MPCVCDAPCVEIEGAETCTACGLERARATADYTNSAFDENEASYKSRRMEAYRRYVGALEINESVADEAARLYDRLVVSRRLVFRGLRNAAVRIACVAAASDCTSSSVKHASVVADTAECARYGYARLRRALDRALDALLGARACFVGASCFGVEVEVYQRAIAKLGCAQRLVRVCTRVDAACFTPSERSRYKHGNLPMAVVLAVATGQHEAASRARLGVSALTASRVRGVIERRAATNEALSRALLAAA